MRGKCLILERARCYEFNPLQPGALCLDFLPRPPGLTCSVWAEPRTRHSWKPPRGMHLAGQPAETRGGWALCWAQVSMGRGRWACTLPISGVKLPWASHSSHPPLPVRSFPGKEGGKRVEARPGQARHRPWMKHPQPWSLYVGGHLGPVWYGGCWNGISTSSGTLARGRGRHQRLLSSQAAWVFGSRPQASWPPSLSELSLWREGGRACVKHVLRARWLGEGPARWRWHCPGGSLGSRAGGCLLGVSAAGRS